VIFTDFCKLIALFLEGAGNLQPNIFGLKGFSGAEFINADFELVGDLDDFHFFEKAYDILIHVEKLRLYLSNIFW